MGGSSLAPEVMRLSFGADRFHVLDTTHPKAIRALESKIDPERTLFLSASKSGTTLETRSHTAYFLERGGQFAAITDPGSDLERFAHENGFLHVFHGEPTIGGRYSALSPFGIVPAVLMGVDATRLLERALEMQEACHFAEGNPGLDLGLRLASTTSVGLTSHTDSFGLWMEQLIAESTGKQGKGILPAPDDPHAELHEDVALPSPYELGQEFFRWEFAVAVAGSILGINPFDQPDVQAAKDKTNAVLAEVTSSSSRRARSTSCSRRRARATTSASRRSSTRPALPTCSRSSTGRARAATSSRTASGRATSTRPGSSTRAARTPASSCRSSTSTATS